ncbi:MULTISPECIES: SigB/SigF/SigG family RNA polymerase sigma factor [Actinoplanes]|uniref:SigB/SigF/SigG family RNA polymerase sigma factor n=1 Tax=Actinoplanes TaxID=1865 RepID=UPI000696E308|nr:MULTISPECIES: SigB/SigF/SigG family RNA polymerase sigma factor [Actinoplanes]GLY08679.1 hypothetical protein Acsp01_90580 [Actinoplanes sp. NBRC 101535]
MPQGTDHHIEDLDQAADEYALASAAAGPDGRRRLREEFVGLALPFARRLAGRYRGRGESHEDLEQVARVGLLKSVDRYDPERGSFTAYAVVTITGEIKRHFRNHAWGVHVPRSMQDLSLEILHTTSALTTELSRSPSPEEIAARLRLDVAEVRVAQEAAAAYQPGSLNVPVGDPDGTERGDLIGGADHQLDLVDDRTTVEHLLCYLPARERRMLALRFYGNRSQSEIAEEMGISQMHVSRLLARALKWLRAAMLTDTLPAWVGAHDTDHRLTITTSFRTDGLRVGVTGEVDRDNADHLREELFAVIDEVAPGELMIDLAGVPLLDAAGIGVLVAVHEAARVRSVRVRVTGLQPYVARIAAASGLRDLFDA